MRPFKKRTNYKKTKNMTDKKNTLEISDFLTMTPCQREGKKVYLKKPDGEETSHWLKIISTESEQAKASLHLFQQDYLEIIEERDKNENVTKEVKRKSFLKMQELQRDYIADLIIDWSFEVEFNRENLIKFLKDAPQIFEQVNTLCADKAFFTESE